jgi:hypothetical protein
MTVNEEKLPVPILIEREAYPFYPHEATRYGLIMHLDFSLALYREEERDFWINSIRELQKLIRRDDAQNLLAMLRQEPRDPLVASALIWRLGNLNFASAYPEIAKYLVVPRIDIDAACVLKDKDSLQILAHVLGTSDNYFHRRRAWEILRHHLPIVETFADLVPISPARCYAYSQKWLATKKKH